MREIKFRVWDKLNKKWFTQDEFRIDGRGGIFFSDHDRPERWGEWGEEYELMQYTGLKDKNGIDIYEGDVLFYSPLKVNVKVVFFAPRFQVIFLDKKDYIDKIIHTKSIHRHLISDAFDWGNGDQYEVVGDVYESPQLADD